MKYTVLWHTHGLVLTRLIIRNSVQTCTFNTKLSLYTSAHVSDGSLCSVRETSAYALNKSTQCLSLLERQEFSQVIRETLGFSEKWQDCFASCMKLKEVEKHIISIQNDAEIMLLRIQIYFLFSFCKLGKKNLCVQS